jgi:hypothetical protein
MWLLHLTRWQQHYFGSVKPHLDLPLQPPRLHSLLQLPRNLRGFIWAMKKQMAAALTPIQQGKRNVYAEMDGMWWLSLTPSRKL